MSSLTVSSFLLWSLLAFGIAGSTWSVAWASADGSNSEAHDNPVTDEVSMASVGQENRDRLRGRIRARWSALVEGDLEQLYKFETPGFRQSTELDAYQKAYGAAAHWSSAEISKVEFASEGNVATVHLMVAYEVTLPDGNQYPGRRLMKERWLFKEGDWWFVQR